MKHYRNTHYFTSLCSRRYLSLMLLTLLALLLAACGAGSSGGQVASSTPTEVPVNGFGVAANHVHALLALPNHVLLLATHYGTYRSADSGQTWQRVSGGPGQMMQGLMEYALTVSPLNPQRIYLLTLQSVTHHGGTLGLYTSTDTGQTWQLAIPTASLTQNTIFTAAAGNDTPDEVYIYQPDLGALGLKVSLDAGQHFTSTGALPFGTLTGVLPLAKVPGTLLIYGSSGIARSTDAGIHWQVIPGITGGIYDLTTAGPNSPIYAAGDAGIYASNDAGKTFTLVNNQASYGSLSVSPSQPQTLYGRTATSVFRSTDGGHTWTALPPLKGNLGNLAVDPDNPAILYVSQSYPAAMYRFDTSSNTWVSLTPKA